MTLMRRVAIGVVVAVGLIAFMFAPVVATQTPYTVKLNWYISLRASESVSCAAFGLGVGYWYNSPSGASQFHWSCPPHLPADFPGCECYTLTRTITSNTTTYATTMIITET